MREEGRQPDRAYDREATPAVAYLILAFALDFGLYRMQSDGLFFPWLSSQALGIAVVAILGLRYWFLIPLSVFVNGYFIWHEGRSVTAIFLAVIIAASYSVGHLLWKKLAASRQPPPTKAIHFLGLSILVTSLSARGAWSLLMSYGLIDPTPAWLWTSQIALRDTLDMLASFPFYYYVLLPFAQRLIAQGFDRTQALSTIGESLLLALPFAALLLPRPVPEAQSFLYLLFLPLPFLIYSFSVRGTVAYIFAVHLWLYEAWPFGLDGEPEARLLVLAALMLCGYGASFIFERRQAALQALLRSKDEQLQSNHRQILQLEENRREWRSLTQTLERLVIRSTQDLRTPLTPIYMWSQMLKESGTSEAVNEASEGIRIHIERQTKMLEELRDSVRISMGHQPIRVDAFDLGDLLHELGELWQAEARVRGIDFRYERPLGETLIMGDREQLSLALQKLFEHLLQYGRDSAQLTLQASLQLREVILHLKHSGYASDQQHVIKLLQAGHGMDPESFLTAPNFDVALYTAKKLIDLQGGRLTAASLNPKPGMLFSLSLRRPRRDAKAVPVAAAVPEATRALPETLAELPSEHQNLMIVEDDSFTLHLLENLLNSEGIDIIGCSNATEALSAFKQFQPNLILADLGLPDINGFELMRRLRKSANHDFVAVAFSACVTPEAEAQAREAGFSAFLAKPLQAKELLETMQHLQQQRQTYQNMNFSIN